MSDTFGKRLTGVGQDGHVSAEDVLFLRRNVFADGIVTRGELARLFELARAAPKGDPEWRAFFVEATADFFLNEEEPRGYLTEEEFVHLQSLCKGLEPRFALELLVALEERAVTAPEALAEQAGALFRAVTKGGIGAAETDLLRRHLYAAGGAGAVAVTRAEAELLFDLHDATAGGDNHPAFGDLFIKAIAAHLMQHVGYRPLPREEALRLHDWVKDQSVNPGGFFNRMVSGGLAAIRDAYGRKSIRAQKNEDDDIAIAIAEQVTAREADWLADRIGRNGRLDEVEKALLAFMKDLEADLPPKLAALVGDAA